MQPDPHRDIARWITVTLGLSAVACIVARTTGLPAIPLVTVAPALAVAIVTGARGSRAALGFTRPEPSLLPLAVLGPVVIQLAGLMLIIGLGLASWKAAPFGATGAPLKGAGLLGVAALVALFEEIAFRGFLLPRLLHLGVLRAVLLSGLAHGLWRLPLMVAVGMPMAAHTGTAMPLVVLTFTFGGAFHGLLRQISGSLWPAVLAHMLAILGWAATTGLTVANTPWAFEYSAAVMIFGLVNLNILAALMLRPDGETIVLKAA